MKWIKKILLICMATGLVIGILLADKEKKNICFECKKRFRTIKKTIEHIRKEH